MARNHETQNHLTYDDQPIVLYWEVTRACKLACDHCRACATPNPHPGELTPSEGRALLEDIAGFQDEHPPHVVLTGGDPLERDDLFDLIAYGHDLGLRISVTPSGTPNLEPETIGRLADAGVEAVALSIDGPSPSIHDGIRGVPNSFQRTVEVARAARDEPLDLYVHTLVSDRTIESIPRTQELVSLLEAHGWSLFFLVRTGRGARLEEAPPPQVQDLFEWLWDLVESADGPEVLRTTEAPHFRAWARRRARQEGHDPASFPGTPISDGLGVRDGNGIAFVSHKGEVHPSGFLPLPCGNVRDRSLVDIYRNQETFQALRQPDRFSGRCGDCPLRDVCGGSRARAYAESGDPLGEDPLCQLPFPEHHQGVRAP